MADDESAGADDDPVELSHDELRELVRTEARDVVREEIRRTRSLFGSIIAGLFGFVILGQSIEAGGILTAILVVVGVLLLFVAGLGATSLFSTSSE
ncbi:hypothetical protein [Halogranum rubrum]|uniref:Uncharacterized protein n=1 Tax=Halogranum salarium B-1 TaxID=1210908 RepID=J3JGA9_9EURY|nr:hypothetical protein [Halogranum salarium]EJN59969.1 hypothetical protein HSB1_21270 [Halogranum salarium B-1]